LGGARVLRGAHIVRHLRVVAEEVDGALRGARHAHHTAAPRMRTRARAGLPPEAPAPLSPLPPLHRQCQGALAAPASPQAEGRWRGAGGRADGGRRERT